MYLIYQNNEQSGPFSLDEIRLRIESSTLSPEDFYWNETAQAWEPLSSLFAAPASQEQEAPHPLPETSGSDTDYSAFLNEKQPRKRVIADCRFLQPLLNHDERLVYVAVQKKPLLNFSPETAVLTTERIFLLYRKFFNTHYDDYHLNDILNLELKKTLLGSHFSFKSVDSQAFGILYLPKQQGTLLYEKARELQEKIRASNQATAPSSTPLPQGLSRPPASLKTLLPQSAPSHARLSPASMPPEQDTLHRLETLKKMLEENLISEEDYNAKKQELLDRL